MEVMFENYIDKKRKSMETKRRINKKKLRNFQLSNNYYIIRNNLY